jgi:hypothetical protein
VVGCILRHLGAEPCRRDEGVRVFTALELNAEKIQCARRDEALKKSLLAAPESHDRALEADLARTHVQERLGL